MSTHFFKELQHFLTEKKTTQRTKPVAAQYTPIMIKKDRIRSVSVPSERNGSATPLDRIFIVGNMLDYFIG